MPQRKSAGTKRKSPEKPFNGGEWTKAKMMSFVRSHLRRMSMKWPPIYKAMNDARRPCKKGRQRWEYKCAHCEKWWPRKEVCADHRTPCGALRDFDDAGGFLERLLVEKSGIDVLCKNCHALKTKREREDGKKQAT